MEKRNNPKTGLIILVSFLFLVSLLCFLSVPSSAATNGLAMERPMQDWSIVFANGVDMYTFNLPAVTVYDEAIPVYVNGNSRPLCTVTYRQVAAAEGPYGGLLHAEITVLSNLFPDGIQYCICSSYTPLLPMRKGATETPLLGITMPSGTVDLSGHYTMQAITITEDTDSYTQYNLVDTVELEQRSNTPGSTYSIPTSLDNNVPYLVVDATVQFHFPTNVARFTLRIPAYEDADTQVVDKFAVAYRVYNRFFSFEDGANPLGWLRSLVDGIFRIPIFVIGDVPVTIGGILFTFLVIPAVVALLRLFGGG